MPSPIAEGPRTDDWPSVTVFDVTYPFPTEAAAERFYEAHKHRGATRESTGGDSNPASPVP